MTVSSFCESRNGPYTNFRHAIAEAIGITANVLERAIEAEAAQEMPLEKEEGNWMEGFEDD